MQEGVGEGEGSFSKGEGAWQRRRIWGVAGRQNRTRNACVRQGGHATTSPPHPSPPPTPRPSWVVTLFLFLSSSRPSLGGRRGFLSFSSSSSSSQLGGVSDITRRRSLSLVRILPRRNCALPRQNCALPRRSLDRSPIVCLVHIGRVTGQNLFISSWPVCT